MNYETMGRALRSFSHAITTNIAIGYIVVPRREIRGCDWFKSRHVTYAEASYLLTGQYSYVFKQYRRPKWPVPGQYFPSFKQYCLVRPAHNDIGIATPSAVSLIFLNNS